MRTFEAVLCIAIASAPSPASGAPRRRLPAQSRPRSRHPRAPAAVARVTAIELGSALDAESRVAPGAAKTTFSPSDTIYVSILTDKPPAGTSLSARWTFEDGQVVSEGHESLTSSERTATEFHIAKPDGLPAGRYKVEIALNGQPAGAREFEVR